MGNQQSRTSTRGGGGLPKPGGASSKPGAEALLQALPSISKSDTKESSISFRALRSKIPGSSTRTDSPRNSAAFLTAVGDNSSEKGDAASIRSSKSARSSMSRASRTDLSSAASIGSRDSPIIDDEDNNDANNANDIQPPPSPTISPSVVRKVHGDVEAARAAGDVDAVSDQPVAAGSGLNTHLQAPGASILVKRDSSGSAATNHSSTYAALPRAATPSAIAVEVAADTVPAVSMSDIKDIDLDDFIKRLQDAGYSGKLTKSVCLKNAEIQAICLRAQECFLSQPALIELDAPVKVVGDVHGQYTDLLRLFEMCGFPPSANYLFLGDYVDRGKQSLETILLLLCYKIKFPENFFLLRGNHECANITRVYGFYDECKRRCNVKTWKTFIDCFNTLPIAAIIASKIFTVHGGLSPALTHMDDIRNIVRPTDVPDYGLLNDLLWSDPFEMEQDWETSERGVSYCFNKKVISDFLTANDFDLVCRAHMVVEDGYEFFTDRLLVTVFSAPNYCGEFDNWGAVMSVSSDLLCSFELLKPLDSTALKSHIKKGRSRRVSIMNSPPAMVQAQSV